MMNMKNKQIVQEPAWQLRTILYSGFFHTWIKILFRSVKQLFENTQQYEWNTQPLIECSYLQIEL